MPICTLHLVWFKQYLNFSKDLFIISKCLLCSTPYCMASFQHSIFTSPQFTPRIMSGSKSMLLFTIFASFEKSAWQYSLLYGSTSQLTLGIGIKSCCWTTLVRSTIHRSDEYDCGVLPRTCRRLGTDDKHRFGSAEQAAFTTHCRHRAVRARADVIWNSEFPSFERRL